MKKIIGYPLAILLALLIFQKSNAQWTYQKHYAEKMKAFTAEQTIPGASLFLGDSITQFGLWSEYFPNQNTINRGIAGDITAGVINRLEELIARKPAQIFLMIGINDVTQKVPLDTILAHYLHIVQTLKKELPQTKLYVQSTLPTKFIEKNKIVLQENHWLKKHAKKLDYKYIDVFSSFYNPQTKCIQEGLADDGVHPNPKGYAIWVNIIKPLVNKTSAL